MRRALALACGLSLVSVSGSASDLFGLDALRATGPAVRSLRLAGISEPGHAGELVLSLVRQVVVAPGGRLVVHGADGVRVSPLPATRYWTGEVEGRPGSRVTLAVHADGEVRALLADERGVATARALAADEGLTFLRVPHLATGSPFRCALDELAGDLGTTPTWDPPEPLAGPETPDLVAHTARVAVETDFEYYQLFGSVGAATEYAVDLLAFSSTIYSAEVDTSLEVVSVSIWSSPSDPWAQSSPGCALYEFGKYWNDNRQGISRTIAHFLSGKSNGGGVAWVGVLCSGAFNVDISGAGCTGMPAVSNYGGAYGYTGTIDGDFDPGNPLPIWDTIAVSHEIGHNFGSPHTHCYAGYAGESSHVDQCWNSTATGCYQGTTKTLPGIGSVTGGTPGAGNGSFMSYCHLLAGGYPNISLTFGLGHPYGVAAERVPQRMAAHVASRASSFPACLAPIAPDLVFEDDFESGTLERWN